MPVMPQLAEVAQLVGDPGRANILSTLMDGRALTGKELAIIAGVTAQTASSHLAKLVERELLTVEKRGPRRFFRLATPLVAQMLEGIMNVALLGPPRFQPKSRLDDEMRHARTCYDHLAGQLGVGIVEKMCAHGHLLPSDEGGDLTPKGGKLLSKLGVELNKARVGKRVFCRPCLDWTERRPHLGGALGAALAERCFDLGWVEHMRDSRGLKITASIGKCSASGSTAISAATTT